jgi:hypothetical protein
MKTKKFLVLSLLIIMPNIFLACDLSPKENLWIETSQKDFADGTFDGGGNLYASARGNIQVVQSWDLNCDGWLDIVFSNYSSDLSYNIDSEIFWGSPTGFSLDHKTSLPTHACISYAIADLNDDSYLDVIFGSWQNKDHDLKDYDPKFRKRFFGSDSLIYWGSASGFEKNHNTELYTFAPTGITVADLNNDGFIDIIFASSGDKGIWIYWGSERGYRNDNILKIKAPRSMVVHPADLNQDGFLDLIVGNLDEEAFSRIYFGGREGFTKDKIKELPTSWVRSIAVADLNRDSYLDIIFANGKDKKSFLTDSFIYWGASDGYSERQRTELPTALAMQPAVADLNRDGFLDIVFANCTDGDRYDISSYIYYGSAQGFSLGNRVEIQTCGAHSVAVADYDNNGEIDLVFSSMCDPEGKTSDYYSLLFYQKNGRFSLADIQFPTYNGHHNSNRDLGNIYDREFRDIYISSIFDARKNVVWRGVEWDAQIPTGSMIKIFVRAGDGKMEEKDWVKVKKGEDIGKSLNGRFCQYKAEFCYDGKRRPKLEEVRIRYR